VFVHYGHLREEVGKRGRLHDVEDLFRSGPITDGEDDGPVRFRPTSQLFQEALAREDHALDGTAVGVDQCQAALLSTRIDADDKPQPNAPPPAAIQRKPPKHAPWGLPST